MRCKYCGGEVNLSVGRCISCARPVDDTSDIRILHDLGALAEKYGLDPNAEKYTSAQETPQGEAISQATEAFVVPRDIKAAAKPKIELQTYYELLGDDAEQRVASGTQPDTDAAAAESDADDEPSQSSNSEEIAADDVSDSKKLPLRQRVMEMLDRADKLTEPVTERIRLWVESKMPRMNRAQSSSKWERLAVGGAIIAAVVLLIVIISSIVASIPENIKGEWIVSDEDAKSVFTVVFSGGNVTARVYDDNGDPYIYKKGTYKIQRQNGRDLLTIEYEDGSLAHLYYELYGKTGHFTNVDTGASDKYTLMD